MAEGIHDPVEMAQHARKRPGMYIGRMGSAGYHDCLWIVVDQAVAGFHHGTCTGLDLTIHRDGSFHLRFDYPGIDVAVDDIGCLLAEVFTLAHLRRHLWLPFLDAPADAPSAEVFSLPDFRRTWITRHHGQLFVVNALSEFLVAEIHTPTCRHRFRSAYGLVLGMEPIAPAETNGITIHFRPDPTIFGADVAPDAGLILDRFAELACLLPGARFIYQDLRPDGMAQTFHAVHGLADMELFTGPGAGLHPVVQHQVFNPASRVGVDLAFQFMADGGEQLRTFINTDPIITGVHVTAYREVIAQELDQWRREAGITRKRGKSNRDNHHAGLRTVMSVTLPEPRYSQPTRDNLINPEVSRTVITELAPWFRRWFADHPDISRQVTAGRRRAPPTQK